MAYNKRPPNVSAPDATGGLSLGQTISHPTFGLGHITRIDGANLTVTFTKTGVKKVVASFVTPA